MPGQNRGYSTTPAGRCQAPRRGFYSAEARGRPAPATSRLPPAEPRRGLSLSRTRSQPPGAVAQRSRGGGGRTYFRAAVRCSARSSISSNPEGFGAPCAGPLRALCSTVQDSANPAKLTRNFVRNQHFFHFAPSHNAPGSLRIGRGRRHRSDPPSGHTEAGPKSRPRTRTVPEPRGAPASAPCAPPGSAPRASRGSPATLLAIPSQATARENRPQPNPVARGLPPRERVRDQVTI